MQKTEALPKCPHGVYLPPGTPGSKKGVSPHCSVCCGPTVREAPGTLTVTANAEAPYRRR